VLLNDQDIMDFSLPDDVTAFLREIDDFIETRIEPLQAQHPQYFDHRR